MAIVKPTRKVGPISFIRLDLAPESYQWTTQLTSNDRLFVHPAGTKTGRWCTPDVLPPPSSVPAANITGTLSTSNIPSLDASKIASGQFGTARIPDLDASKITSGTLNENRLPTGIDRAKLANRSGERIDITAQNVTSTSYALKYTLSNASLSSTLATTGRVLWGFELSGYCSHESSGSSDAYRAKTLRGYANLKVGGVVKGYGPETIIAGSGTQDPNFTGLTLYDLGAGTASRQGIIDNPGAGTVTVDVYAKIVLEVGSPSVDGVLLSARAWWLEI